jgi:hypothetical protein
VKQLNQAFSFAVSVVKIWIDANEFLMVRNRPLDISLAGGVYQN